MEEFKLPKLDPKINLESLKLPGGVTLNHDGDYKKQEEALEKLAINLKNTNRIAKLRKNLVISYISDSTGCGHIRNIFPMLYLQCVYGKSQTFNPIIGQAFIKQGDILLRTQSILFQRHMNAVNREYIRQYKGLQDRFKFKMVYDMDDLLWGRNENQGGDKYHGIPCYNYASERVTEEMKLNAIECMKMMNEVCVSTDQLKDYIENKLKIGVKVSVVPNAVPMYLYGYQERKGIKQDIKKPIILYNASPTHYSSQHKMKGDMDNAWLDYILKSVEDDTIEFHCAGGDPFFFDEIRGKFKRYKWANMLQYPQLMKEIRPDFIISPLVPNHFNSCKSDIKYIEAASIGSLHIGTTFKSKEFPSPYDNNILKLPDNCTVKDIEEMISTYSKKEAFNEVQKKQYKMLEDGHRYIESRNYVQLLMSILSPKQK